MTEGKPVSAEDFASEFVNDARQTANGIWLHHPGIFPARIEARDAAIRLETERAARERIAEYVATHYPVYRTGSTVRWEMEATSDGGRIQRTYAEAIRGLKSEGGAQKERA